MPASVLSAYDGAAVVIPAHNQRAKLPACLRAVLTAALCAPIPVTVVVVLDDSDDDSAQLAGRYGPDVHFISVDARNVGAARAVGFGYARSLSAPGTRDWSRYWYATTDADSRVDPGWLVGQLGTGADVVLGVVRVTAWHQHSPDVADRYLRAYEGGAGEPHEHIHGANMGFPARAYWRVGGFRSLACGEDVDLVERFEAAGHAIHRDTGISVMTSARTRARAPHGFAHHLRQPHHLRQRGTPATGDCA